MYNDTIVNHRNRPFIPLIIYTMCVSHMTEHRVILQNIENVCIFYAYISYYNKRLRSVSTLLLSHAAGAASQCYYDELMLLKCELMLSIKMPDQHKY